MIAPLGVVLTNAARLLVRCLESEGVRFLFGIPGEETLELMDSLRDSAIRFVLTRHEEAAAFMADVHGRLSGRAGVCMATLGPGATNLVTGVADAFLDRAPLVAVTAQQDLSRVHRESHQFIDVLDLFDPITKWNARVENPEVVPEIVRKAFKIAETEKPGPTHVELPENVAREPVPEDIKVLAREESRRPAPDPASLRRAAALIDRSDRPVILAGNGVIRGGAAEELTTFAERLAIPVVETYMGKGSVPWSSAVSILTIGFAASDYADSGLDGADLAIAVGYDHVEYEPRLWNPKGRLPIVHIDFVPAEISSHYAAEVEIVGDIRESLRALASLTKATKSFSRVRRLREKAERRLESWRADHEGKIPKPQRILAELREVMGADDLLISDVGAHKIWVGRSFRALRPNTVLISNGLAAMGIALPGGVAAKLLYPGRNVVTVSGDGGFLMSVHELETAKREGAATVNLVWRDGGLGSIRWKAMARFGRATGTEFGNPDLPMLAKAFGVRGFAVEAVSDLPSVLEEAMRSNAPCVVDIPVDYRENPFLAKADSGRGSDDGRPYCPNFASIVTSPSPVIDQGDSLSTSRRFRQPTRYCNRSRDD